MKISVIGPTWPFRGGIAHYTTLLVKHLRERHDVRLISYLKQYPKWLYPGNTAMDPSPDAGQMRIESDRVLTPLDPLTWFKAFQIIHRDAPDVLLLQWWTPFWSPFLFFLTRLLRLFHKQPMRTIFLCHHMIAPDGGIFDWFLARRILWRGDAFIVMSEEDFALLRRALPHALIKGTAHPPYDVFNTGTLTQAEARATLSLPAGVPVLLFFGFVRHYKGLKHLIEALPMVRKALPARLMIVGEFWEDERPYRELIRKLGLEDCVTIVNDYVPNEALGTYFAASDAVVMPYLEATQSGVAQLAISFEKPMIATSVGGMPEIIRDGVNGLIVPPADPAALAGAVLRLFQQPGLYARCVQAICTDKDSASWQPLVQLIEALAIPAAAAPGAAFPGHSPRVL